MPRQKRLRRDVVRRNMVGVPKNDWVGQPGEIFRDGLHRLFGPTETNAYAKAPFNEHPADMRSDDSIDFHIQDSINAFNEEEEQKLRKTFEARLGGKRDSRTGPPKNDNLISADEVLLLQVLKGLNVKISYGGERLTISPLTLPMSSPSKHPRVESNLEQDYDAKK